MQVLKFGGTSVANAEAIQKVVEIVSGSVDRDRTILVVSAIRGCTDSLIHIGNLASQRDESYIEIIDDLQDKHHQIIRELLPREKHDEAYRTCDELFDSLRSIAQGVYLLGELSPTSLDAIQGFGELWSSKIIATKLASVGIATKWVDSRKIIRTVSKGETNAVDIQKTYSRVNEMIGNNPITQLFVMPGFIASDKQGRTTTLGRGGSDYSASLMAVGCKARALEIWTDVNGFMTADPRVIPTTYTINELSYIEAMELCNFGAKVIYPPTIYPVCVKNIPIRVKNTFNTDNPGTIIKNKIDNDRKPIKGISSINGTTLITVTGLSMVGVIGVNRRIFTVLADNGISVFMVSQASSENSTSIGVRDEDATNAVEVLNKEFAKEIETGAMYPMHAESGLATIAIVGENMKHTPGIAGKLFGTLGRSGISVIACAQGASETNISFVVEAKLLRKSLNVLHDSFFLSEYKVLNLFICGIGTVGGNLIEQIRQQHSQLMENRRLKLNVVGIASSRTAIFDREGIDLSNYKEKLAKSTPSDINRLRKEVLGMNIFNSVFVDCTASNEVSSLYQTFLENNISVVAANKVAASSDYESYLKLKETALRRGVKFLFETNVGAGLPIICTINDLCNSGDKILKIEAVLSGTLNFIFNEISAEVPFSETVRRAKEQGYSEPDPRIDLSGKDVVRKLVILTREAGYKVEQEDVEKKLFVPDEFFNGTIEDFWKNLPNLDSDFEEKRKKLEAENKRWRFVAKMDHGKTSVSLESVGINHPFYGLEGSNNIVLLTTERYKEYPMQIQGYGAGAGVTAAGVFANIMSIANI
jgi:aspartokinase/homoserine dehydrogenase 1